MTMKQTPVFMAAGLPGMLQDEQLKPYLENMKTEFRAEENGDTADLYIYGVIGESFWGDAVSAKDVMKFLKGTAASTINIYINSPGGDVFDGIAIYNQLKRQEATVNIHVDGIAASAASVIAMAGDKINMPKTSMLMIHHAWTIAMGNAKDFRKVADDLDKIGEAYAQAYLGRFTGSEDELQKLLDDETYLTASEAVTLGFADAEVEDKKEDPKQSVPAKQSLLAKYAKAKPDPKPEEPKNILARFQRPAQA